jgi:methionyl-tRNA formyltransferase
MFGLRCRFTDIVLRTLMSEDLAPSAILIPGPPQIAAPIKVSSPRTVLAMAGAPRALLDIPGVPVYQVGRVANASSLDLIRSFEPEVVVVACYPTRIPRVVWMSGPHGAINIHPSLLPRGRGPDPIFWSFRRGESETGVTVHQLTDQLDAGPIFAQERIDVAAGVTEAELESRAARVGGALAARVIRELMTTSAHPRAQDDKQATYETFPGPDDFVIDLGEGAEIAFRFIRGIRERSEPITIDTGPELGPVSDAICYAAEPDAAVATRGRRWIRFADGYLLAEVPTSAQ